MIEENMISPNDINLFRYVETAEEAWELLKKEVKLNNNCSFNTKLKKKRTD